MQPLLPQRTLLRGRWKDWDPASGGLAASDADSVVSGIAVEAADPDCRRSTESGVRGSGFSRLCFLVWDTRDGMFGSKASNGFGASISLTMMLSRG